MPDLYLLLTPFVAFFSLLSLLNLKFALAQPKHQALSKYQSKTITKQDNLEQAIDDTKQQGETLYFKTFKYLLKNFTLIELCLVRRNTNKIPQFFTISCLAISSIFIKTQAIFLFSSIGFMTTIFYILAKVISASREKEELNQFKEDTKPKKALIQQKNGQKLEIILTSISLLTNLTIIWCLYKNTNNSEILSSTYNFLIIFALDNFLLKPLMLSLFAFPLKFWSFTHVFIDKQSQIIQILRGERVLKRQGKRRKILAMNRVHNSTSNTQNTLEIQPCVNFDIHGNNITNSNIDIKDASKCSFTYKKSQGKNDQSQSSLVKYISYPFKNIQPNTVGSRICNLRITQLDQKLIKETSLSKKQPIESSSIKRKRNKLYCEKIGSIPQFIYDESGLPKNTQNEEEIDPHLQKQGFNPASYLSAKRSSTSRHNESAKKHSQTKVTRQSIERNTLYHSNQRPNSIIEPQIFNNSCVSGFNYTGDLLKIREDKHGQDLQQIDMNSPERYKNQIRKLYVKAGQQRKMSVNQNEENLKSGATKVFKKYSLDPNNQILQKVIQNRNFEMKSIEREEKTDFEDGSNRRKTLNRTSQMNLSRKSDVFARFSNDSRMAKSVKRTKNNKDPIVRQNDENRIPQFVIQDFTC